MRTNRLAMTILLSASALAFSQSTQSATQNGSSQPEGRNKGSTITGCLTSGSHHTYRLKDQKGVTNMVYSSTVHLDHYVKQFVTLIGNQSAKPSTDEGTGRQMPHFVVFEVQPASGQCK